MGTIKTKGITPDDVKFFDEAALGALKCMLSYEKSSFHVNTSGAVAGWACDYAYEMVKQRRNMMFDL